VRRETRSNERAIETPIIDRMLRTTFDDGDRSGFRLRVMPGTGDRETRDDAGPRSMRLA
jgi:polyribonucleotide nucleotidyltransferase